MISLTEVFCKIDDFCQEFEPYWHKQQVSSGLKTRNRRSKLSMSEMLTILVWFHVIRFRDFKTYYTVYVEQELQDAFPKLLSYNRFIQLMPNLMVPLSAYLQSTYGRCSGISFIDSTPIAVCHNRRIAQHKVFAGIAARGHSSMGWFYGFKLHLVVNDKGELLACKLTPGNTDDRKPVPSLTHNLIGKLIADKGYISKSLFDQLYQRGLKLITKLRKNMKNQLMPLIDKLLLRKRAIIESIVDQLKNISHLQHTRHRSRTGFVLNLLAGLVAYSLKPKKPSLDLQFFHGLKQN